MLSDVLKQDGAPDIVGQTTELAIKTVGLILLLVHLNMVYEYANFPDAVVEAVVPLWTVFIVMLFLPNVRAVIISLSSWRLQLGLSVVASIAVGAFLFAVYPYGTPRREISQLYLSTALLPLFLAEDFFKMLLRSAIQRAGIEVEDQDVAD